MSSGLYFVVVLCLTSGLWIGANASSECCKRCPPGWTQYGDKCFIFNYFLKSWIDSELDCLSKKGNLASIHSLGEYNFVFSMIQRSTGKNTRTWIGGHDIAKEGSWQWTDGSFFGYKIFPKGQPSNGGRKEHCLEMNWRNKPNDVRCHERKPYICSKSL